MFTRIKQIFQPSPSRSASQLGKHGAMVRKNRERALIVSTALQMRQDMGMSEWPQ